MDFNRYKQEQLGEKSFWGQISIKMEKKKALPVGLLNGKLTKIFVIKYIVAEASQKKVYDPCRGPSER